MKTYQNHENYEEDYQEVSKNLNNQNCNLSVLLNFYKKYRDFDIYENSSIQKKIVNNNTRFYCRKCKIEFINMSDEESTKCPDCGEISRIDEHKNLLRTLKNRINQLNIYKGFYQKSWLKIFKTNITSEFFKYNLEFHQSYKNNFDSFQELINNKYEREYESDIIAIDDYQPKNKYGITNKNRSIWGVKDHKLTNINEFTNRIDKFINSYVTLCSVPPSKKNKVSGIDKIIYELSRLNVNRVNGGCMKNFNKEDFKNSFLIRIKDMEEQRTTRHGYEQISESIEVNKKQIKKIEGKNILLIDDVTTKGTTFKVCFDKLNEMKANRVICLALGKTI